MLEKRLIGLALVSLILSIAATAHADEVAQKFLVVSDIDDTIKITDVLSIGRALKNGLFGQRTFTGMSELYQELEKNGQAAATPAGSMNPPIVYMSGSPPPLKGEIRDMLVEDHHFPDGRFMLRDWIKTKDVYSFKTAGFKALALEVSMPFVALGDDTEKDPEVLTEFATAHPGRAAALYIHRVTGRAIPAGATEFYTAFDVALMEFEAGRLNAEQVARVGNTILASKDPRYLFPDFTQCPEDLTYDDTPKVSQDPALMALKEKVADYIRHYCFKRNNGFKMLEPPRQHVVAPSQMNQKPCPGTVNVTPAMVEAMSEHMKLVRSKLVSDIEENVY